MLVSYSSSEDEGENEDSDNINCERQKGDSLLACKKRCRKDDSPPTCKKHKCATDTGVSHDRKGEHGPKPVYPRLPLPGSVLNMFSESEDSSTEDRSLHGGRVRTFQHERGNWATYVYLPYFPDEVFLDLVGEMTRVVSAHGLSLTWAEEFHVSLSQTVVLRHHWIQPFILSLRKCLASYPRVVCSAERMKVYTNHEETRTFLGVEVTYGHAQLLELVKAVDQTMEEFSLSTFYENPSFHISLAWCVGNCADQLRKECLQELQTALDSHEDGAFLLKLSCEELRCKSGNKVFTLPLH